MKVDHNGSADGNDYMCSSSFVSATCVETFTTAFGAMFGGVQQVSDYETKSVLFIAIYSNLTSEIQLY
jgi:hypothetical protein